MNLGTFGVWAPGLQITAENAGEAARLAEDLGFGAMWLGGSPRLPLTRTALNATERLAVATGIVNIWEYEPSALAAEYAELEREFPDRLMVGVGVGHRESKAEYVKPLTSMRAFLDGLDAAPSPVPPERRCLAALGPKMLDLSGQRTRGTCPYFIVVEHTRFARERLGPEALVAPNIPCVIDTEADRARATARAHASLYLGLRNYTNNLRRFGFGDADIADGGSDRLIDAVIPHGTADEMAEIARLHIDAGANHVSLRPLGETGIPRDGWTALAAVLYR